jgi:hypothetical protein
MAWYPPPNLADLHNFEGTKLKRTVEELQRASSKQNILKYIELLKNVANIQCSPLNFPSGCAKLMIHNLEQFNQNIRTPHTEISND